MARSVNKIILVGRVGHDPDIHTTSKGKIAHFSLATNRRTIRKLTDCDESDRTDWHRLVLRGHLAEFAEDYVKTGDRVYVEGRLEYDSYRRAGVHIPTAEIVVTELVLITPKAQV